MARVLVVDDTRVMRYNMKKLLEELGHDVVGEAANGHEAIVQYKSLEPDVVTLDITMPPVNDVADGIDALKSIVEYDEDVKAIMMTAHGEKAKVMEALRSGASGYLLKPIQKAKLDEAIKKLNL